ncbi:MAG: TMEM43 family protein [Planctomycetota bacterium]|nr:TMEM43 family protein [Planctomycetota bacterium]
MVSVSADKVDPALDQQLVHLTAEATTEETLTDADFKFSAPAIKLRRRVEMYQWKEDERTEERKKLGGGVEKKTTWTYEKTWSPELISSQGFKQGAGHENPGALRFPGREEQAKDVHLGAFELSPGLVGQISNYEPLPLAAQVLDQLPEELRKQIKADGNRLYLPNDPKMSAADPAKAEIGDLRVSFEVVKPAQVSILARQLGNTFESWVSGTGTQIERLTAGAVSAQDMLGQLEQENTILTWLLRGGGFLCMTFGIGLVFSPLAVLADVVPFLGDLLRMGVGLFAAVVAGSLSLVTVAAAWLAYRPVLGIGLLVLAGVLVLGLRRLGARKHVAVG